MSAASSESTAFEPDLKQALATVMELMAIPGKSGEEGAISERVQQALLAAGADPKQMSLDSVHKQSPIGGQVGNLVLKLPGTVRGPRRMLSAHIDTVPLCQGCQPKRQGDEVRSADPTTALGADDRAGATVVLNTAQEILRRGLPHPPLTFVFFVQEEVGLHGARLAPLGKFGKPKLAFNFDGGSPEKLTIGATGAYRLEILVKGIASHAGGSPEKGVSAIVLASLAMARLQEDGWHGDIIKGRKRGTSNFGLITGGNAVNVVADSVRIRAEARSHDPAFRQRIVKEIEKAFQKAAKELKNIEGKRGSVEIAAAQDYESFRLDDAEPCVLAAEAAVQSAGLEPLRAIANGGLDANWLSERGIPTVTLGCGQRNPHTVEEYLDVPAFENACRVALRLATAVDG